MANQTINQDEFEAWRDGYLNKAAIKAMMAHASELKVSLLRAFWEAESPAEAERIFKEKAELKTRIDVIEDLATMDYEAFNDYFKSE